MVTVVFPGGSPVVFGTKAEYAAGVGVSVKAVTEWLKLGLLPGAYQDADYKMAWRIPLDASRPSPSQMAEARRMLGQAVEVEEPAHEVRALEVAPAASAAPTPLQLLEAQPGWIPIAAAMEILQISRAGVRATCRVERFGRHGSLVVSHADVRAAFQGGSRDEGRMPNSVVVARE